MFIVRELIDSKLGPYVYNIMTFFAMMCVALSHRGYPLGTWEAPWIQGMHVGKMRLDKYLLADTIFRRKYRSCLSA